METGVKILTGPRTGERGVVVHRAGGVLFVRLADKTLPYYPAEVKEVTDTPITLGMKIGDLTLAETVERMKKGGFTRLLVGDSDVDEELRSFRRSYKEGHPPTNGEILAAYYEAAIAALDAAYEASGMSNRSYSARKAAIYRVVFR